MKRIQKSATALTIIASALLFAPTCTASDNGPWYSFTKVLSSIVTGGVIAKLTIDLWFRNQAALAATREQAPRSDEEFERFLQANLPTTEEISPEVKTWILAQQPATLQDTRIISLVNNHLGISASASILPPSIRKKFPQADRLAIIKFSSNLHHVIKEHVAQANQDQENESTEMVKAVFQHEFAHVLYKHAFDLEARFYGPYFHAYFAALTFLCSGKHSALTSLATLTGIKIGLPMLELFLRRRVEEQADDLIQTERGGRTVFATLIEECNEEAAQLSADSGGMLSQEFCRRLVDLQDPQYPSPDARLARLEARFAKQRAKSYLEELRGARFAQVGKDIYVPQGFCKSAEKSHLDPELDLC